MRTASSINRRILKSAERHLNLLGRRHQCNICKKKFHHFYPFRGGSAAKSPFLRELKTIGSDVDNYQCPACGCHDRERHLFMFFDKLQLWHAIPEGAVLHFAPEQSLKRAIMHLSPKEYVQADLCPQHESVRKVDVRCIDYPNEYFDFVLCNHVLEHVVEDETAMSELFRVLKRGKGAILQTPYSGFLTNAFVDPSITTDALRVRYYGQEDHIRVYGRDLFRKLECAGFRLDIQKHGDYFSLKDASYFGVNPKEDLILVWK